jgi:hypothetical protein
MERALDKFVKAALALSIDGPTVCESCLQKDHGDND